VSDGGLGDVRRWHLTSLRHHDEMPKISFAVKPTLTGELVILRPLREADAVSCAAPDPEVRRLGGTGPNPPDEVREWYRGLEGRTGRLDLAIIERATGECVGIVALDQLDSDALSCNFRIMLARVASFDRGMGTQASRLITDYAFDVLGINRIELGVFSFNDRARHVYEKLGFVHEGTRRQATRCDGEWHDLELMAMIRSDRTE
jgi:RimJ/RimL family protein N-acetyltransferase